MDDPFLFQPASFFMVRTPLLPIDDFFALCESKNLKSELFSLFETNALFREAIAIASSSLYHALLEKQYNQKTFSSLLKYFIRMSTRPTPFGMFSCVSLGGWGEKTSVEFDINQVYKKSRPDMKWLKAVFDQLLQDPLLTSRLPIKKNSFTVESGDRILVENIKGVKESEKKRTSSIRNSFLIKDIINLTKKPISIESIIKNLIIKHPKLDEHKLKGMLQTLIAQKFLLYDFAPSLLNTSPFNAALSKLSALSYPTNFLEEIANGLKKYDQAEIGEGEMEFNQICHSMTKIADSKHFIQLDTAHSRTAILSNSIAKELQESTELLWKIGSIRNAYNPLEEYYEQFAEKYGTSRTVPLLDLLNEDRGLGIPPSYLELAPNLSEKTEREIKWNQWLHVKWAECLKARKQEIEIKEEEISQILREMKKENALFSFDLSCEIIQDESDAEDYLLNILPFAWQGGASFGRFLDILKPSCSSLLRSFFKKEDELDPESIFIESSFYDENAPRSANVTSIPNLRKKSLDLNGNGSIALDEIYIGANMNRLFATSKDGSKEFRFTCCHMLNPTSLPIPLRFLKDVHLSSQQLLLQFPWLDLDNAFFHPRIRYKNTVFSPAKWKIDLFTLNCSEKESNQKIADRFKKFADTWDIPDFIQLTDIDNRLLLNRKHPDHIMQIASELKKNKEIILTEKMDQKNGQWVSGTQGKYSAEFVIPFIKNAKYKSEKSFKPSKFFSIPKEERQKILGSDWIYLKLYIDATSGNHFLMNECHSFSQVCQEEGLIQGWFFIRYADPLPHFRVRYHLNPNISNGHIIDRFYQWLNELLRNQTIRDISFGTYEREIERYGGEALMPFAEKFFCADSQATVALLKHLDQNKILLPVEVVAAISIVDLLKGLGLNLNEQHALFESFTMKKDELSGFREHKKSLMHLISKLLKNQDNEEEADTDLNVLVEAFSIRRAALYEYAKELVKHNKNAYLTQPIHSIYDTLIHMHCNRLMTSVRKERKARLFAYYTLKALIKMDQTNFSILERFS